MEETVDPLEHVNMDARYQEGAEPDPFTLTLIGHSHPSNTIALMNTLPPEIISLIFSSLRGILLAKDVRNFPLVLSMSVNIGATSRLWDIFFMGRYQFLASLDRGQDGNIFRKIRI